MQLIFRAISEVSYGNTKHLILLRAETTARNAAHHVQVQSRADCSMNPQQPRIVDVERMCCDARQRSESTCESFQTILQTLQETMKVTEF